MPYANYFKKNEPWNITRTELCHFPIQSLGYALGQFLITNDFHLIPKLERHDAYHVITNYGTTVEEEIALQFFFLGNGKTSLYLFAVITIGFMLLPEYYKNYYTAYLHGKSCNDLYKWSIKALLNTPLHKIQSNLFEQANTSNINV